MAPGSAAEIRPRADAVTEILADAYHAAALRGHDMVRVAQAFEHVARSPATRTDLVAASRATTRAIAVEDDLEVCAALAELRDQINDRLHAESRAALLTAFDESSDAGWTAWIRTYARAVHRWPDSARTKLCEEELPFAPERTEDVAEIRRMNRCIDELRWDETYPLFERLAEDPSIATSDQAVAVEYLAMIELHVLQQPPMALQLLERAGELDPSCSRVHAGWAEYWLEMADPLFDGDRGNDALRRSRDAAARALELDQHAGRAHLALGDAAAKELDAERAVTGDGPEAHYRRAIAAGEAAGCLRIIWRTVKSSALGVHDPAVKLLLDKAVRMFPDGEYAFHLQVADALLEIGDIESADRWQRRAIDLDPRRPAGYVSRGIQRFLSDDADTATQLVDQAIALAPDAFDGWQTQAWLAEQRGDWARAVELYAEAIERRPSWEARLRGRIADCLRRLRRDDEAIEHLRKGLAREPGNDELEEALVGLVHDRSVAQGDPTLALEVYDELRRARGERYERRYRNLRGNVFFSLEDFVSATAEYERAAEAPDADAITFANLAGAWEERMSRGELEEGLRKALDALKQAHALAPDDEGYTSRLRFRERQEQMLGDYGPNVLGRNTLVTPVLVEVTEALLEHILVAEHDELSPGFLDAIHTMRMRVFDQTGIEPPGIRFTQARPDTVTDPGMRCFVMGVAVWAGPVPVEKRFAPASIDDVKPVAADAEPALDPVDDSVGCWIPLGAWDAVEGAGIPLWGVGDYLLRSVERVVRSALDEFVNHDEVAARIDDLADVELAGRARGQLSQLTRGVRVWAGEGRSVAKFDAACRSILGLRDASDPKEAQRVGA
jgi:tetratricopeptide (TPR) repeat protein